MLAAGCEKQKADETTPPALTTSFTAKLDVTFGDTAMTAALTQTAAEKFEIQMLSPEIMKPLMLSYSFGKCTVTYEGLKFESDVSRFPQAEFGSLVTQALTDIGQDINIQKTYADGIWKFSGTGERGVFSLTVNGETGEFLELTVDGADLKAVFSEFVAN